MSDARRDPTNAARLTPRPWLGAILIVLVLVLGACTRSSDAGTATAAGTLVGTVPNSAPAPVPFPTYLPADMTIVGGKAVSQMHPVASWVRLYGAPGGTKDSDVWIIAHASTKPWASVADSTQVRLRGVDGQSNVRDDRTYLYWREHDLNVEMVSVLPKDQLIDLAGHLLVDSGSGASLPDDAAPGLTELLTRSGEVPPGWPAGSMQPTSVITAAVENDAVFDDLSTLPANTRAAWVTSFDNGWDKYELLTRRGYGSIVPLRSGTGDLFVVSSLDADPKYRAAVVHGSGDGYAVVLTTGMTNDELATIAGGVQWIPRGEWDSKTKARTGPPSASASSFLGLGGRENADGTGFSHHVGGTGVARRARWDPNGRRCSRHRRDADTSRLRRQEP